MRVDKFSPIQSHHGLTVSARLAVASSALCVVPTFAAAHDGVALPWTSPNAAMLILSDIWAGIETSLNWLTAHYAYAPALVLGLFVFVLFPSIAILVGVFNRALAPDATDEQTETAQTQIPPPARATKAVLELHDPRGVRSSMRFPLTHPVVQIGRSQDVDILVNDPTVHRLHAAIHRTEESEYCVTDLCAGTGNGVAVNGQPVFQKTIHHGDEIQIGRARLTFFAT